MAKALSRRTKNNGNKKMQEDHVLNTYLASGATRASFLGISVMRTSVVSTKAAIEAAFSMALMVTYHSSLGKEIKIM